MVDRLEARSGRTFFFRNPRGIEPTPFGTALYQAFTGTRKDWLTKHRASWERIDESSGSLTVGCHSSIALYLFPRIYSALLRRFPKLEIKSELHTSIEVSRRVAEHQLDLGIVVNPVKHAEMMSKPLLEDFVAVWTGRRRAGAGKEPLFYNPEMYQAAKFLPRFKNRRLIQVASYEVIARILREAPAEGILPSTIAEIYGLRRAGPSLFSAKLSLIWHRHRFPVSSKSEVLKTILSATIR